MAEIAPVVSEPHSLGLSDRAVEALARKVAERKLPLFAFCPDIDADDLVQEGLLAVSRAQRFDPSKGKATTFAYLVIARSALDLWRSKSRQVARDLAMARPDAPEPHPADVIDDGGLVDWVRKIRDAARVMYGTKSYRFGPRFYRLDRVAALVLLQSRLKLSSEGMRWVLSRRPDLLEATGFRQVPGPRRMADAAELLRIVRPTIVNHG